MANLLHTWLNYRIHWGPLIYISLNHKRVYCVILVILRSSQDFDDRWIISKNICNNRLFNRTPLARHVAMQLFKRASQSSHYGLSVSFSHLISPPPTGRVRRRKPVRSFIPCHLIILGERLAKSENLRLFPPVRDFRNFGSRLRTSIPRIKNSK